ncbi:MAG: radical SAM protein [Planctomycetota bacterium]|nr:MAG: radical SAM protein [Planctomycetota bacterium]
MEKRPGKEFTLKWLAWEATRRCNLHCVHCRSSSDESPREGEFSTGEAKKLLDDIASFAKPVVVLSGGEPLLREDIFEIARYGTDKDLRMCMATNGVLVDDAVCGKILDCGIKMVSLSLDGAGSEVHDDFRRQEGAFEGTINAAELFRKHGIKFLINSSFTKRNQTEIIKIYHLAKELGATAWYMFLIVPTGRGADIQNELVSKEDYEEILRWHAEMEFEEDEMLVRPTCAPQYYRVVRQVAKEQGRDYKRRSLTFSTGGSKGCIAGQSICLIDAFGEVQPCSYFPKSIGNVRETPLKDLWENSPLLKELRDFSAYKGRCGQCEYLRICGGCRARAAAITDDYLEEEPFCAHIPLSMQRKKEKHR